MIENDILRLIRSDKLKEAVSIGVKMGLKKKEILKIVRDERRRWDIANFRIRCTHETWFKHKKLRFNSCNLKESEGDNGK